MNTGAAMRPRSALSVCGALLSVALLGLFATPSVAQSDDFVLSTTQPGGPGFAPAFVGNGYLAGRQPAEGQGYAEVALPGRTDPLPTQSEVQGFYAQVSSPDTGTIERRAALPTWSTLTYDDGSGPYSLDRGHVANYLQQLDLRAGTLTTSLDWTSPAGQTVHLRYDVTPDRARRHAAIERLRFTPQFSGKVTITDLLDGAGAEFTTAAGSGHSGSTQWVDVATEGLGVRATVASVLRSAAEQVKPVSVTDPQSAAQKVTLNVRSGQTYDVNKSVGIAVSTDTSEALPPHQTAVSAATNEDNLGYGGARTISDAAWAPLWASDIEVAGDAGLQRQVRASFFWLLASARADTPWAPSPGGLSSDGYGGHVFWDNETWMYPSMLATEPALAKQMLQYRVDRLDAARQNAQLTGYQGARFPWESALSGLEETPSCCLTGKLEVHVNSDIALGMWQYWLATGDKAWLANSAWPVLSGIADFWVSRSVRNADGSWSIRDIIPPDEYAEHVDDSVYTNISARDSLRIASRVAAILGKPVSPAWTDVADNLRVLFDSTMGVHPEYQGYPGDTVKQADVTLLSYPWENDQSNAVTQSDLDYYVPRTDPNGPSMTDGIHSIVTSKLGTPGCAAFTFTKRSVDPFMRGPYDQFSEARTGGAFTFTTGAGGFLQEFLYGYSGMRWRADQLLLDPSLPPQLTGVTLNAVHWQGRTVRIAIARGGTRVTLVSGSSLPLSWPGGSQTLAGGGSATIPTRTPDTTATDDVARCEPATASPATAEPPQAADDGTDTTTWLADDPGTAVTVDLGRGIALRSVSITRPPVLAIASSTPGGTAVTGPTDSAGEKAEISADGSTWTPLATVADPQLRDDFAGSGQQVRYVRVTALGDATASHPLVVGELSVRSKHR